MLDAQLVPDVDPQETLSRYVFSRRHVNSQSKLLKADAFIPHRHTVMSATRDREASESEIWAVGQAIAARREKVLVGRGDAIAQTYLRQRLAVIADPIEGNPNHANVSGWPAGDRPAQKMIAQEIAAVAKFVQYAES